MRYHGGPYFDKLPIVKKIFSLSAWCGKVDPTLRKGGTMLKARDRQVGFYDADYFCEHLIPHDSFYRKFREIVEPLIQDEWTNGVDKWGRSLTQDSLESTR